MMGSVNGRPMEIGGGMVKTVRMLRCVRGATSVEYAILAAIMVVVLVAVLEILGPAVGGNWNSVSTAVTSAGQ